MSVLIERLRAEKTALAMRVVADMYEDPFWDARFAARGRKYSDEDVVFHVDYLIQALAGNDADVMGSYARWLQNVLTTRGMCTLHLADSFGRLAAVVNDTAATTMLSAARVALFYPDGAARTVQERIRDAMVDVAPDRIEDPAYHLSYVADALQLGQPRIFIDHVKWLAGYVADVPSLVTSLEALASADPLVATALRSLGELAT